MKAFMLALAALAAFSIVHADEPTIEVEKHHLGDKPGHESQTKQDEGIVKAMNSELKSEENLPPGLGGGKGETKTDLKMAETLKKQMTEKLDNLLEKVSAQDQKDLKHDKTDTSAPPPLKHKEMELFQSILQMKLPPGAEAKDFSPEHFKPIAGSNPVEFEKLSETAAGQTKLITEAARNAELMLKSGKLTSEQAQEINKAFNTLAASTDKDKTGLNSELNKIAKLVDQKQNLVMALGKNGTGREAAQEQIKKSALLVVAMDKEAHEANEKKHPGSKGKGEHGKHEHGAETKNDIKNDTKTDKTSKKP